MAKSKSVVRKKTERPTAVQRHVNSLRLPADLAQQIDRWAKAMGEDSHSEGMRHLLELGLSAADRSAPMPVAPVPQGDVPGVAKPKSGVDPLVVEQLGGLVRPDRREDEKLWLRVPTPSTRRSELWKGPTRPPRVTYDWNPIENAPFDEDVAVQVTDGRGSPYAIRWPSRLTATGWINSRKGNPLEVAPVSWRPYHSQPRP
jgi:hypothetical protein